MYGDDVYGSATFGSTGVTATDSGSITSASGTVIAATETSTASESPGTISASGTTLTAAESIGSSTTDAGSTSSGTATTLSTSEVATSTLTSGVLSESYAVLTASESVGVIDAASPTQSTGSALTASESGTATEVGSATTQTTTPITSGAMAMTTDAAGLTDAYTSTLTAIGNIAGLENFEYDEDKLVKIRTDNHYVEGEDVTFPFKITSSNGQPKNLDQSTINWYLIPERNSPDSDAVLTESSSDVDITMINKDEGRFDIDFLNSVTDGLGEGLYWQRLVIEDANGYVQKWRSPFPINES